MKTLILMLALGFAVHAQADDSAPGGNELDGLIREQCTLFRKKFTDEFNTILAAQEATISREKAVLNPLLDEQVRKTREAFARFTTDQRAYLAKYATQMKLLQSNEQLSETDRRHFSWVIIRERDAQVKLDKDIGRGFNLTVCRDNAKPLQDYGSRSYNPELDLPLPATPRLEPGTEAVVKSATCKSSHQGSTQYARPSMLRAVQYDFDTTMVVKACTAVTFDRDINGFMGYTKAKSSTICTTIDLVTGQETGFNLEAAGYVAPSAVSQADLAYHVEKQLSANLPICLKLGKPAPTNDSSTADLQSAADKDHDIAADVTDSTDNGKLTAQ